MALATKCPQCGSLFRVVADQLKLRGGLVRCGQCRTVFDAIGSLTYVDEGTLTPTGSVSGGSATSGPATAAAAAPTRGRMPRDTKTSKALGPTTTLRIAPGLAPVATISSLPPLALPPAASSAEPPVRKRRKDRIEDLALSEAGVPTLLAPSATRPRVETEMAPSAEGIEVIEMPAIADPPPDPAENEEPAFIRASRRAPRRGFSIVFSVGAILLVLIAAAQLAVIFRADLLARVPASRPVLAQLCEAFGCTLGWSTQPDQLAVIGSELQALPGVDVLELTAAVRNRASFTQALPALEVTLTDARNQPIARKVFTPADYLAAAGEPRTRIDQGLAPGADFTIRVFFEARGVQAAGFLVYPFFI